MTISLAGASIQGMGALSPLGRLALSFVDGGPQWLEWAARHYTSSHAFADETLLVAEVQKGLHASPYAFLPRLGIMVSPVKLMTMGLADLGVLAQAEQKPGEVDLVLGAQLRRVLADHQVLVPEDLKAGMALLGLWGVADDALFQSVGFQDALHIHTLLNVRVASTELAPDLQKEAARFGVEQARTVAEFVDYVQVYLVVADQLGAGAATPDQRAQAAQHALQTLLPLLFSALECPRLRGLPAPAEVGRAVGSWLASGKLLGFARLSDGVRQVVTNAGYLAQTGDAAAQLVNRYLQEARSFLSSVKPDRGSMGQDGATCTYHLERGDQSAELRISSEGVITLRRFGAPAVAPTASTAVAAPGLPVLASEALTS